MSGREAAALAAGMMTAVALTACGAGGSLRVGSTVHVDSAAGAHVVAQATQTATAAPTPATPVPLPPATFAPVMSDVLVVSDVSPVNGRVEVVLVRDDGTVLGRDSVSAPQQWSVSAGPQGAYWVDGSHLHHLDTRGHSATLGAVEPDQNGHIVVSPDGRGWIYATSTTTPDGVRTNRLWRGGSAEATRMLAQRVDDPMHPTPGMPVDWVYSLKSWTGAGVLVVREPAGGCGCAPFDMETVAASSLLVDPATGDGRPLATDDVCPFSGAADDATVVCFYTSGAVGAADELRVLRRDGTSQRFTLSGTTAAGDARFDQAGGTIAYATVPSSDGCGDWTTHTTLRVIDLGSGAARAMGPLGLQPMAWMAGSHIGGMLSRGSDTAVVSVDVHSGAVRTLMHGSSLYVVGAVAQTG